MNELEPRLPFEDDDRPAFEWDDDLPQPLDPHDRYADPERTARVSVGVNEWERKELDADGALSDFGSSAWSRRWARHGEEE
jgi:hypothetical protein